MDLLRIIALSLLIGCVGAGFMWFGWELVENLRAAKAARSQASETNTEAEQAKATEDEAPDTVP